MNQCRLLISSFLILAGSSEAASSGLPKEVCVGRFTIRLPADAAISSLAVTRNGVSLGASKASSSAALKTELENESAVLRSRRHAKAGSTLIESKAIDSNTFLLSWYDSHASLRLARVRVYSFVESHGFVLEQTGPTEARQSRGEELVAMARRLRTRATSEAGLCFDGGFLVAPDDNAPESVQVSIELPGKPDVRLTLDTNTNNGELPESVTTRVANSGLDQEPAYAQVRKLFSEQRTINGIAGEAAGYKVPTTETILAHRMVFQSLGATQAEALKPEITLTLKSGEQRDDASYPTPSVSDEEARKLFDDAVGSLKIRPHNR